MELLLTKSTTPIIGWIASLLGLIMNGIYEGLAYINQNAFGRSMVVFGEKMSYANIGLAIILYTVIVYLAMTPLQIKQQKNSKMMSVINPELQKIQQKYRGKNDQASRMKMQEETQALYNKYGVSMSGSCVTLAIQMPLLFALYQVIYKIPGYITNVGNVFKTLAEQIQGTSGSTELLKQFLEESSVRGIRFSDEASLNQITDFLYLLKPSQWKLLASDTYFSSLSSQISDASRFSSKINNFAGINISESPLDVIRSSFANHTWLLLLIAILVPVLAWFTQWLNYKLMPQAATSNGDNAAMDSSMRTMNLTMPIFSAFLCVTFSMGIGIYWIAGALIRCVQQVVINQRIAKMDANELIAAAQEKRAKKEEKQGVTRQNSSSAAQGSSITSTAHRKVKQIKDPKYKDLDKKDVNYSEAAKNAPAGSLTAKANMVAQFDEKNSRKSNKKKKQDAVKSAESAEQPAENSSADVDKEV